MSKLIACILMELRHNMQPAGQVLLLFLSLYTIFALIMSPYADWQQTFRPIILAGLAYAILGMSLTHLFQEDYADGILEWHIACGKSLERYALIKIIAHWLQYGVTMALLAGILTGFEMLPLPGVIALTTLSLTLTGAIGSALCLNTGLNAFMLLPVIILPLGIPAMIAGMAAMTSPAPDAITCMSLQTGLLFMAGGLSLVACPYSLKLSLK